MFNKINALTGILILAFFCAQTEGNKKCYKAKICIHDGQEKCGKDENGNVRTFIDSCDLKEYNCLQGTDYKKTSFEDCQSPPSLDESVAHNNSNTEETQKDLSKSSSKVKEQDSEPSSKETEGVLTEPSLEEKEDTQSQSGDIEDDFSQHPSEEKEEVQSHSENNVEKVDYLTDLTAETTQDMKPKPTQDPGLAKVINEYWCWRAKYCRNEGSPVCARDLRLNHWRKFQNICSMYKLNCRYGHVCLMPPYFINCTQDQTDLDPLVLQRHAEFNCYKLKTCTRGGPPVCGFDDFKRFLAQFADMCTFYQVNCQGKGVFVHVDENICEGQKRFEFEHKPFEMNSQYFIGSRI